MITDFDVLNFFKAFDTKCSKVSKRHFTRGETITTYVEKRNQVCILLYGEADLIRYDYNGNKTIIGQFSNNDIFGEAFYPVNTNNELFVQATEKCEVILFLYDDIRVKCKNNCRLHNNLVSDILELVLNKTIHQNTRIEVLSKRTIREKLLTYFTILSSKNFSKNITLPLSLTSLADYLSVDRSAMMREIKSLINEGFISKNGNKIKLLY